MAASTKPPARPDKPADSIQPVQPAQPIQTSQVEQQAKPVQPVQPVVQASQPAQPTQPTTTTHVSRSPVHANKFDSSRKSPPVDITVISNGVVHSHSSVSCNTVHYTIVYVLLQIVGQVGS